MQTVFHLHNSSASRKSICIFAPPFRWLDRLLPSRTAPNRDARTIGRVQKVGKNKCIMQYHFHIQHIVAWRSYGASSSQGFPPQSRLGVQTSFAHRSLECFSSSPYQNIPHKQTNTQTLKLTQSGTYVHTAGALESICKSAVFVLPLEWKIHRNARTTFPRALRNESG